MFEVVRIVLKSSGCFQQVEQTYQQQAFRRVFPRFVKFCSCEIFFVDLLKDICVNDAAGDYIVCRSGLGSYSDFYGVGDGHLSSNRSCFYV